MESGQHLYRAGLWVSDVLTGSAAIIVATIAIAAFGLSMLAGRIDIRRGIGAIIGCFILLGASSIAAGLRAFVTDPARSASALSIPPPLPAKANPPPYDPYAGAALGKQ